MLALYVGWTAITLAWSPGWYEGVDALWRLVLFSALFCIGTELRTLRPAAIGFGLGFAINGAIALLQVAGFAPVDAIEGFTGRAAGLFMNRNNLGEAAVLALILALGYRLWWIAALIVPAAVLPLAQGALTALGIVGALWLRARSRLAACGLALAIVAGGALALHARVNDSVLERLHIWNDTVRGLTPLGAGLGSFFSNFPSHARAHDTLTSRPAHPHNDLLEIAYETGFPGLLLFAGFLAYALVGGVTIERFVLIAFIVEGLFAFPFALPVPLAIAGLAAGRLCRDRPGVRYLLARGRMALRARLVA